MSKEKINTGEEMKENDKDRDKEPRLIFKKMSPPYFAAVAVVAIIFFFAGYVVNANLSNTGMVVGNVVTPEKAAADAIDYINDYLLSPGVTATLVSVDDVGYNYELTLNITSSQGERTFTSYVTKDGKLLFISAVDMSVKPKKPENTNQPESPPTVEKTDRPVAHAFVMSYCPFGLQFMKAYIPVMELLGDKADIELNFVHYAMHGKKEIDQNMRMYCIQKEARDKLPAYMRCFVENDKPEECMDEVGIDKEIIESCISETDENFNITGLYNDKSTWSGGRFPMFPVDQELATKYGVRGSPTFVLNDKVISVNRSPEAIKEAVCNAFTNPPEECKQTLSTKTESPGIGPIGSGEGSGSGGQC